MSKVCEYESRLKLLEIYVVFFVKYSFVHLYEIQSNKVTLYTSLFYCTFVPVHFYCTESALLSCYSQIMLNWPFKVTFPIVDHVRYDF